MCSEDLQFGITGLELLLEEFFATELVTQE